MDNRLKSSRNLYSQYFFTVHVGTIITNTAYNLHSYVFYVQHITCLYVLRTRGIIIGRPNKQCT